MADRIHASSEWLDKCARDLKDIENAISSCSKQLGGIKLRRDEGGNLKTSLDFGFRMNGARFSGNTAADDIRALQRASTSLTEATAGFSSGAGKAARLFEEAEDKAVNLLNGLVGAGTINALYEKAGSITASGVQERGPAQTREEYYERCAERRANAIDDEVARLYDKYLNKQKIGSDTSSSSYYNPIQNKVYINWRDDSTNERGECSTYFHETGHMIDDYTKLFGDSSSSKAFSTSLKSDFDNYVNKVMRENSCTREEAYSRISDWLWEDADNKSGLSDLCGGLSNKQCEGRWGHPASYWSGSKEHGIPDKVNNEAFAHFFEASMSTDSTKLDYLKEVFPNAYKEFKSIVRKSL